MDFDAKRREMVEEQLKARGITDTKVLKAMNEVPRHEFVPPETREIAYGDYALPTLSGQAISQPYIVALMTQELELKPNDSVLEIGAGSGYQAAVLSRIAKKVYTVERLPELVEHSANVLRNLCYLNVEVIIGDGTQGFKRKPYDAIMVTAACHKVPDALKEQLKEGGRLVIPIGDRYGQVLFKFKKIDGELIEKRLCECVFVPLIGPDGWEE